LVRWEDLWIGDFTSDPALDIVDVGRRRDADWLAVLAGPGVARSPGVCVSIVKEVYRTSNLRSCCHCWTGLLVAHWKTGVTIGFLKDLEHTIKQTVLLHDWKASD